MKNVAAKVNAGLVVLSTDSIERAGIWDPHGAQPPSSVLPTEPLWWRLFLSP